MPYGNRPIRQRRTSLISFGYIPGIDRHRPGLPLESAQTPTPALRAAPRTIGPPQSPPSGREAGFQWASSPALSQALPRDLPGNGDAWIAAIFLKAGFDLALLSRCHWNRLWLRGNTIPNR